MFRNYKDIQEKIKGEKKISEGNCKLFFIKL